MGMFKRMKDMKDMVEASPDMVRQARQMGAQAQEYAAAQQATMAGQTAQMTPSPAAAGTADFEPVAGVSIELYAEISKGLAAYNYDITKGPEVAASKGVSADDWNAAMTGWNDRIKANRAVAQRFNALYTGRA
jgi:ABC-type amino acid transport substrate-binding protein